MHKVKRLVPLLLSFVLMLAAGLCLAAAAPGTNSTTKTTSKTAAKNNATTNKSTAMPMKEESTQKSPARKTSDVLASAEDLTGTISVVDLSDKEVTLMGSNGIPYDFALTRKTRVELSNQKIGVTELANESHKQATVHFVPTSRGNLAETIQISAS